MFDIGWQELFILAVLAIIVVGPKDLPRAIKTVTHWIRKARSMARDLQDGLDDVVREAELDDIKTEANKMVGEGFDPASRLADEFDMADLEKDWSETVNDLKSVTNPDKDKKLDDKPVRDPVDDDMIDEIAGLDESPGELVLYRGRHFKSYRGMGSLGAMGAGSADRYGQGAVSDTHKYVPEGVEGRVPYRGSLADFVYQMVGGLRAAMGYCGCSTIDDLRSRARFVRVSSAGLVESHAHDIQITKEAPNYITSADPTK